MNGKDFKNFLFGLGLLLVIGSAVWLPSNSLSFVLTFIGLFAVIYSVDD